MKLLQLFTAAVMSMSIVGCCTGRNTVCDPCNPCGGASQCGASHSCGMSPLVTSGFLQDFSLKKIMGMGGCRRGRCGHCNSCGGCDPVFECGGCGGSCGMASSSCGAPSCGMPAQSDCGCSSPSSSTYTPTYPMTSPSPSSVAPSPPPAVGPADTTGYHTPTNMPSQTVSYEEFQRLPGTIISGPGAAPASEVAASPSMPKSNMMAQRPVQRTSGSMPVASVTNQNRQPIWVPAP